MPKNLVRIVLICLLLWAVTACRSSKETAGGRKSKPEVALQKCRDNNFQFTTLSIAGKGKADVPGQDVNVGISYRINMLADSMILIRVTKLGIEGVRALITRDSIYVLNRLDQTARITGYSAAKEFTGLDADFELLQALILGNFYQVPDQLLFDKRKSNPHQVFTGSKEGFAFQYEIDPAHHKLSRLEAANEIRNQHTRISYSGFEQQDKQVMPTAGELLLLAPEPATFSFRHNRIQIDQERVSFKFNIPSGYERIVE